MPIESTDGQRVDVFRTTTVRELLDRPLNEVEAKHAPRDIFAAGDFSVLRGAPAVSLVGSRAATARGRALASQLAAALVAHGVTVVSGLAEGIDTAAHSGAIDAGGRTAAVLGTPLSVAYPASNRALQRRLMAEHLVLSQFREGTRTGRSSFPQRNRTMALLSGATVIVEARDKSGSLHQGWEALRLGRPLLLMEHAVEMDGVTWPAELVRYGAQVLSMDTVDALVELLPEAVDSGGFIAR